MILKMFYVQDWLLQNLLSDNIIAEKCILNIMT